MRRFLCLCALGALTLLCRPTAGQASSQAKAAEPGVDVIWNYAGTWNTEINHLDTPYSKASKEAHKLENDCWKSGAYVACRQIVDGDPKILLVFTYNDKDRSFTSYQIPAHGGDAHSGKFQVEGNSWIFPWESTEGGKTTYFRVVNVWSSPTTIEFRQEYSSDQKTWTQMATGHEVKTAEK